MMHPACFRSCDIVTTHPACGCGLHALSSGPAFAAGLVRARRHVSSDKSGSQNQSGQEADWFVGRHCKPKMEKVLTWLPSLPAAPKHSALLYLDAIWARRVVSSKLVCQPACSSLLRCREP